MLLISRPISSASLNMRRFYYSVTKSVSNTELPRSMDIPKFESHVDFMLRKQFQRICSVRAALQHFVTCSFLMRRFKPPPLLPSQPAICCCLWTTVYTSHSQLLSVFVCRLLRNLRTSHAVMIGSLRNTEPAVAEPKVIYSHEHDTSINRYSSCNVQVQIGCYSWTAPVGFREE